MKTDLRPLMLCVVIASSGAAAEPLGRLFFTPEQRALFDRQRRDGRQNPEQAIRLDGVVMRSGKKLSVWVNGRVCEGDEPDGAVGLRVGESLDPATRHKLDILSNGSIARSGAR